MLHIVGYILEYYYDARTHERYTKKRGLLVTRNEGGVLTQEPRQDILRGGTHCLCVKCPESLMVIPGQDSNIIVI